MGSGERLQRVFPSTHWSIVEVASREDAAGPRPALSDLLQRYLPALRAHLLIRRSVQPGQIDDLLQSFISSKILEADLLARADRRKGRFRTLLLTALDRYVISRQRFEQAEKRGAARTEVLDESAVGELPHDPDRASADTFDVEWARQILRESLRRMRERCEAEGRLDIWGVFECRLLRPTLGGAAPAEYGQIVERFSYRSPTQLWNAVRTAKNLFARTLRSVVAEYAESDDDVEAELSDLRAICGRLPPQDQPKAAYP
jgi:RNA polymerase sigma-70 factor (ECF subfamily)